MPELDLSFTITAIIALTSLVSPWISNKINNKHQKEMKLLEYEQERYNKTVVYKRQVFENYISAAGEMLLIDNVETNRNFGKNHALACLYVNEDLRKDMNEFHELIQGRNSAKSKELFNKIVSQLTAILEGLK